MLSTASDLASQLCSLEWLLYLPLAVQCFEAWLKQRNERLAPKDIQYSAKVMAACASGCVFAAKSGKLGTCYGQREKDFQANWWLCKLLATSGYIYTERCIYYIYYLVVSLMWGFTIYYAEIEQIYFWSATRRGCEKSASPIPVTCLYYLCLYHMHPNCRLWHQIRFTAITRTPRLPL